MDEPRPPEQRGVPDALRVAIERTLSSVGDSGVASAADLPAETLGRASELLDEVARRGYAAGAEIARLGKGARSEISRHRPAGRLASWLGARISRRGRDARDVSLAITTRVAEAVAETLRKDSKPKVEGE